LGHPTKFQLLSRLCSVTARHVVVGVSQTAALNRGRHLRSAGRPSRWALAHISSCLSLCAFLFFLWPPCVADVALYFCHVVSFFFYLSFGQGSSLLWTQTLRPFYSRPIALTLQGRSFRLMMYASVCVTVWWGGLSRREQLVRYL